jgi:uncharacterized protein (TIGR00255 family)
VMRSMTGFGRAEARVAEADVTVEVRSVNSRHLDVRPRLPRELWRLEADVRRAAGKFFERGQVDVQIRISGGALEPGVELDLETARLYARGAAALAEELGLEGGFSVDALLALPGVARLREPNGVDEEGARALVEGVREACRSARKMREREGTEIGRELRERLERVEKRVEDIEGRAEEVKEGLRGRLERRVAALRSEIDIDPSRLDQEVFFYVERMDATEETVRLRSHLTQFRETLDLDGAVGRKLEFLLQEMGREANTIGQKAADAPVGRHVIELKAEIEKLREQVANVE